ncbi:sulfurtransferase TusA family protein [Lentibacillus saliphilus]|uniref:sulfurtransferase TusA family protein n=1 Tax=Lentibacillus saliphilus TaxID=2737028 RepID=UPI001C2F7F27|nr:sulfurtransferase TusA family protein [Lentibacillus saliphilus]
MIKTDKVLDAKGLACPMPIVKTKKGFEELEPGQVIEIQATDQGSTTDLKAWAEARGHEYLGTIEDDGVLKHYLRKASDEEAKEATKHQHVIDNAALQQKLTEGKITLIDVREQAEYAFNHIPGAVSIPMGELEARLNELNAEDDIYVICRTGNRSDMAAQLLAQNGFNAVTNVVPGMSEWNGDLTKTVE